MFFHGLRLLSSKILFKLVLKKKKKKKVVQVIQFFGRLIFYPNKNDMYCFFFIYIQITVL